MAQNELTDLLADIGWTPAVLATRLGVRVDTVTSWTRARREPPPNVLAWLRVVRDKLDEAPPLPEGWAP